MARRYLKQKHSNEIFVWTEALAKREDMEEFIKHLPVENDASYVASIPRIQSDVIRFFSSARGLGDVVPALYAACGLADAGHEVEFFTPRTEWLYVSHPGVKIIQGEDGFDANANYRIQLEQTRTNNMSRVDWYLSNIALAYGIKEAKPSRPAVIEVSKFTVMGDYILLCPFSIASSRTWLGSHWRRVAIDLQKAGKQVVVMGVDRHKTQLEEMFYGLNIQKFINVKPDVVISLIQHAECVLSNDSGPAHLAGLYGKKAIALVAQFRPEYLYHGTNNVIPIVPEASCVGCHEQEDGGWDQYCHDTCSALQIISPEQVVKEILNVEPDIKQMAQALLKRKPNGKQTSLGKTQPEEGKQTADLKAKGIGKSKG